MALIGSHSINNSLRDPVVFHGAARTEALGCGSILDGGGLLHIDEPAFDSLIRRWTSAFHRLPVQFVFRRDRNRKHQVLGRVAYPFGNHGLYM